MAWLNATPEKSEITRREMYSEDSPTVQPIDLTSYEAHLIALWHECGTISSNGMGISALPWEVISKWAELFYSENIIEFVETPDKHYAPVIIKQLTLLDYELQIIRQLSQEYANEYSQASDKSRPCPKQVVVEEISKEDAFAESMRFKEALFGINGQ